jgi:predicted nucleic-acid-binding protein
VNITADTNVLLRAVVGDDEVQQQMAIETLKTAELVAISAQSLCEFVWVLDRGYKAARGDIASTITQILEMHNIVVNRPAVEAGLRALVAVGDFAHGVIAYDGNWLGGETLVSFDRRTVSLVRQQGQQARLLA